MIEKQEMYNEDRKNEFLNQYDPKTVESYRHTFYRSFDIEDTLGKDLHDFTSDEIKEVLINGNHSTYGGVRNTYTIIKSYISWATTKYRGTNIDLAKMLSDKEIMECVQDIKEYFSEDELSVITEDIPNFQEKAMLQILFEGAFGHMLSELSNLKKDDINWETGEVTLYDNDNDKGERKITVSEKCLFYLDGAYSQEVYFGSGNTKYDLPSNDYIFKTKITRKTGEFDSVDRFVFYSRLKRIGELFNRRHFTAKTIHRSGMIKMAKDIFLRDGKLEKEQLNEIGDAYGWSKANMNGYQYYITTYIFGEKGFINRQNILDLYDIDIEK